LQRVFSKKKTNPRNFLLRYADVAAGRVVVGGLTANAVAGRSVSAGLAATAMVGHDHPKNQSSRKSSNASGSFATQSATGISQTAAGISGISREGFHQAAFPAESISSSSQQEGQHSGVRTQMGQAGKERTSSLNSNLSGASDAKRARTASFSSNVSSVLPASGAVASLTIDVFQRSKLNDVYLILRKCSDVQCQQIIRRMLHTMIIALSKLTFFNLNSLILDSSSHQLTIRSFIPQAPPSSSTKRFTHLLRIRGSVGSCTGGFRVFRRACSNG
jgi:hypothetical protein